MMMIIASSNAASSREGRCGSGAQLLTNGCLSVFSSILGYLSLFVRGLLGICWVLWGFC